MNKINSELLDFIHSSPTAFHTVANIKSRLRADGYTELFESSKWFLEEGGKYFITRGDTSIIAFRVPSGDFAGFQIVASHTDSPAFKLKPTFEICDRNYVRASTDRYGGMLLSSWLDRPLSVAGRLVINDGGLVTSELVMTEKDVALIPSIAPHVSVPEIPPINDMIALVGERADAGKLLEELADSVGCDVSEVVSHDLYLVNRTRGTAWGVEDSFISSPRLDDLQCVFTSLLGFMIAEDELNIPVFAAFDKEEVGNGSTNGGGSMFLPCVLERISAAFGRSRAEHFKLLSNTFLVSADNSHATHPTHPEKTDMLNSGSLNAGIAIKHSAMGRYVTDGESAAVLKALCRRAEIPYFDYTNRSDIIGGTTLGHDLQAHLSVSAVDMGLSQLAMHSCCETAGAKDTAYAFRLFSTFYSTKLYRDGSSFVLQ